MANLKAVVRKDYIKQDLKVNIKIRISHDGKVRYIKTPWSIEPRFMDITGQVNARCLGQAKLNKAIYLLLAEYNGILDEIGKDIIYMDINTITSKLRRQQGTKGVISYFNQRVVTLESEKRYNTADMYSGTAKKLKDFAKKDEIQFKEINIDFLNRFEIWLKEKGKKINSIKAYFNSLRSIFNHAIDNEVIKQDLYPFRKFKVKGEQTRKRNLKAKDIKILLSLELTPVRQQALDLFMLSFYLLGMNFKDMLFLTSQNITNDRINYVRSKTKEKKPDEMSVKLVPEALAIINKYKGEKYLLKFLDSSKYRKPESTIIIGTNAQLKKICLQAGLDIPISTYYARHTVATLAYKLNIQESTISEILGHSSQNKMTNIYIERDTTKIDAAQRLIIDSLA